MRVKVFWKSKTFIFGVVAPLLYAGINEWLNGGDTAQIVAVVMATVNLIIRKYTTTGMIFALTPPQQEESKNDESV